MSDKISIDIISVYNMDPTDENFQSVYQTCRLCMSEEFLEDISKEEDLQEWIFEYLSIKVTIVDGMTHNVCDICRLRLSEFHQFRIRCQEVQTILQAVAPNQNGKVNESMLKESGFQGLIEHVCTHCGQSFEMGSHLTKHLEMHEISDRDNLDGIVPTEDELQEVINQLYGKTDITITKKCKIIDQEIQWKTSHGNYSHTIYEGQEIPFQQNLVSVDLSYGEIQNNGNEEEQSICIVDADNNTAGPAVSREQPSSLNQIETFVKSTIKSQKVSDSDTYVYGDMGSNQCCTICSKEFQCRRKLRAHISVVHGPKKQRCYVCDVKFTLRSNLLRHLTSQQHLNNMRNVQSTMSPEEIATTDAADNSFKCTKCERTFSRACYLRSHMKLHLGKKTPMAKKDRKRVKEEKQ